MAEPDFKFNILTEEEASEDAFEDESHGKIADSLFNIITSQKNSINIGLSGEWGSGKSTVIRMLKEKMKNNYLFFIFDSWAYENDSLRIDFLLEFINEITTFLKNKNNKILEKFYKKDRIEEIKKWEKKGNRNLRNKLIKKHKEKFKNNNILMREQLKENEKLLESFEGKKEIISGKIKIENESDNKYFSFLGILFVIALYLTTFGSKIIDFFLQDSNKLIQWQNHLKINNLLIFLILPFVFFCLILRERVARDVYDNEDRTKNESNQFYNPHKNEIKSIITSVIIDMVLMTILAFGLNIEFDSVFVFKYYFYTSIPFILGAFFCDKEKLFCNIGFFNGDIQKSITHIEENLSLSNYAYEFREKFKKIVQEIVKNHNDLKIIIVLDNLDRISSQKALELWTVMQIFMQRQKENNNSVDKKEILLNRVWFIVPYDETAILKLWNTQNSNGDSGRSFLEKSFQIRIDVPEINISSEVHFVKNLINEVTKSSIMSTFELNDRIKSKEDWLKYINNEIEKHFFIVREFIGGSLSPREIKTYINQVLFYYSTYRRYKIEFSTISYFVLFRYFVSPQLSIEEIKDKIKESYESVNDSDQDPKTRFLRKNHKFYLPENFREQILGIIYGCIPEKGKELLIERDFYNSVKGLDNNLKKKKDEIHKLINIYPDAFRLIIETHSNAQFGIFSVDNIMLLMYSLETYNEESEIEADEKERFKVNFMLSENFINFLKEYFTSSSHSYDKIYKLNLSDEDLSDLVNKCKNFLERDELKNNQILIPFCECILQKGFQSNFELPMISESEKEDDHEKTKSTPAISSDFPKVIKKYFKIVNILKQSVEELNIRNKVSIQINEPFIINNLFALKYSNDDYNNAIYIDLPFLQENKFEVDDLRYLLTDKDHTIISVINNIIHLVLNRINDDNLKNNINLLCTLINEYLSGEKTDLSTAQSSIALLILLASYKENMIEYIYTNLIMKIRKAAEDKHQNLNEYCRECYSLILHVYCLCFSRKKKEFESLTDDEKSYLNSVEKIIEDESSTVVFNGAVREYIECLAMYIWKLGKEDVGKCFYKIFACDIEIAQNEQALTSILNFDGISNNEKKGIIGQYNEKHKVEIGADHMLKISLIKQYLT